MSVHLKFKVGWSTDIGRRSTQQDEYVVVPRLFDGDIDSPDHDCGMFGVLDGHGTRQSPTCGVKF
jgi:hypothetical protein